MRFPLRVAGHAATFGAACVATLVSVAPRVAVAQAPAFSGQALQSLTYRNVGPFRMGARVSAIAVPDGRDHLYTFYVGFWTGGLWKTTNNGTTFEPIFDGHDRLAIGAVAIGPRNPDLLWVGTGDAFTSRSSLAGDGIYKSTDAGKTWTNMGLKDSHHIARIVIDPTNARTVYVAAMGHLFSENTERGVFKTTDGGRSWQKVLYVNAGVGVIDLVMHPTAPGVLYAATYDKTRRPWQIVNGGPGTAIYKTVNGGRSWTRLAKGLPTGQIGRIGLTIFPGNPNILYAVIENENPRDGTTTRQGFGEVYRSLNGGSSWTKMSGDFNVSPKGPYYFSQIFVHPRDAKRLYVTQDGYFTSADGGTTWNTSRPFPRMFGDFRTLWIDPANPDRMIGGSDGSIAISYDGGRTSDAFSNIPVGENYKVFVDMEEPYNIYAGLQDHEHWKGPSNVPMRGSTVNDWLALGGGDGIYVVPDTTAGGRYVYTTREYGQHFRLDQTLGYRVPIMPRRDASRGAPYRFIWEAPIFISPHNSSTIYAGAQMLLKSTDRGDHWSEISPDLSSGPTDRILPSSEGGVPGGIPWFAISSISESPSTVGLLWAGTSDGKVHVTRDGGVQWTDVTPQLSSVGMRDDAYVSGVRASVHVPGRAFVAKSGYRFDDFTPYLAMTEDFGATWRSIQGNLPHEPINVIWEDTKNPDLLFVGNDGGVFVSIDRGAHWVKMNNNMPNVSVKDLLVHPREQDLVVGSYARGIWIMHIAPLQELTPKVLVSDAYLFTVHPTTQRIAWSFGANDYLFGQRHLQTPNDPEGMAIYYYLRQPGSAPTAVTIRDSAGREVARLNGPSAAGINRVVWSTRVESGAGRAGRAAAQGGGPPASSSPLDQWMPLGEYTVSITAGEQVLVRSARIVKTIGWGLDGPTPRVIR